MCQGSELLVLTLAVPWSLELGFRASHGILGRGERNRLCIGLAENLAYSWYSTNGSLIHVHLKPTEHCKSAIPRYKIKITFKWQPTPVFLPGESQRWGSLMAAVCGVTQSRTQLKRLSSSSKQTTKKKRLPSASTTQVLELV